MKEVTLDKNRKVSTPWLTSDEAALYCGIHRNTFDLHSAGVPCGGSKSHRRWHVRVLDKWVNNELPVPFSPHPREDRSRKSENRRKKAMGKRSQEAGLVDPGTGKVFI